VPRSETSATVQEVLAAVLALIAGYVDAYTFLNYQVYGSFLSGNTTQTGLQVGQGKLGSATNNLLPIPLFVAGVFLGALFVHSRLGDELRVTKVGTQSVSLGYVSLAVLAALNPRSRWRSPEGQVARLQSEKIMPGDVETEISWDYCAR
jgi:uncharacterized membrane protein YoaK (UPF0700 family)